VPEPDPIGARAFQSKLADRLTQIRLAVDLGEITTPEEFRAALELGGIFDAADPEVRRACFVAGLGGWLR